MKIIAFGHKKRVGKDTAAKFLMAAFRAKQINCQRLSFGDQIKSIAHRMFGHLGLEDAPYYFNHPESIEQILPAIGKSPRQIWDDLGVMGRKIWPYTWSSLALKDMDCDIAICSDFRTKEDYQALSQF